ncbi:hypothetical protein B296_00035261 [Ensete ventricosum]|uniref:Uncharacterized protein n=1 Tax=Ensete ventricosum TaxID=4639 RepID=A0A426XMW6_ENSVE|nr:hypothetical protein B296_00035261 [Ensete ventricosum]
MGQNQPCPLSRHGGIDCTFWAGMKIFYKHFDARRRAHVAKMPVKQPPYQSGSSTSRDGADYCTLLTAAHTIDNPSIGSFDNTPRMESPAVPNWEDQPEGEAPQRRVAEVHPDSLAVVPVRSRCHSRDSTQASPDLDTLSYDSTESYREQVRQVHQRLDKVQKEVLKSKEELEENSKGGSLFTPKIQDKPLSANFRLPSLELYDGSCDPTEYVVTFHAQMALYDTSDALMCRAFPTTLRDRPEHGIVDSNPPLYLHLTY